MDLMECIKTRRSVRKFLSKPVPWDSVGKIVDAGRCAPSPGNLQNFKFIVVLEESSRKAIADACVGQLWMAQAPVHIVVCAENEKAKRFYGIRGERLYSIQASSAAVQNMLLAAHSLGIASCWVGAFDEEKLSSIVRLPENVRPQAVLPLGYSGETVPEPMQYQIENMVFMESWNNTIKDMDEFFGYTSAKVQKFIEKGKNIVSRIISKAKKE